MGKLYYTNPTFAEGGIVVRKDHERLALGADPWCECAVNCPSATGPGRPASGRWQAVVVQGEQQQPGQDVSTSAQRGHEVVEDGEAGANPSWWRNQTAGQALSATGTRQNPVVLAAPGI